MVAKYLILAAVVALQLLLTSAQAPEGVVFYGFNYTVILYDNTGVYIRALNLNCNILGPRDASLAADGKIWTSDYKSLYYFDPETQQCGEIEFGSRVSNAFASPSGAYVYYLMAGSIYRLNVRTYLSELALERTTNDYSAFGFYGSTLLATRSPYATVERYAINANDDIVLPSNTVVFIDQASPPIKAKTCAGGEIYCFQTGYEWISRRTGDILTQIISFYDPRMMRFLFDYWTAPWGQMYVLASNLYIFESNLNATTLVSTQVYSGAPSPSMTTFVAFLPSPNISVSSDCQASVQFNTYNWTSKYTVQVQNPLTGLFENDQVQTTSAEGAKNVQLTALCNRDKLKVRVRLDGVPSSDPIFSLATTITCSCQAPVPNVQPILECLEQTNNGTVVHLGYNNLESYVAQLSVGPNNRFSDVDNRNQPTSFAVGRSNFYPDSAFKLQFSGSATWFLSTYALNFDTSDTSVLCPQNVSFVLSFTSSTDVTQSDIDNIRDGIASLLNITSSRVNLVNVTSTPVTKKRATNIVQITFEITAAQSGNELSAAESVRMIANLPTPTLTQIINGGDNSNGRTVTSVSTVASGTEQQGQDSNAPIAAPQSDNTAPTKNSTPKGTMSSAAVSAPTILLGVTYLLVTLAY